MAAGMNTFQIFSSSPRQWAPYELGRPQCEEMSRLREKYDLKPLVIHVNYLVNLASTTELFLKKSIEAFHGEVERAFALCAEHLVLHPGSFRGADREAGLLRTAAAIAAATKDWTSPRGTDNPDRKHSRRRIFVGRNFEQVAEVLTACVE